MKITKYQRNNIIFLVAILLLIIPQTRKPIQVVLHKGLALIIKPSVIDKNKRVVISDFNWTLKGQNNNEFNFNSIKGNVIVVNFWATWCPPCIAEMPSLQELYKDYKSKVEFVFVSNENTQVISEFMTRNNYSFKVFKSVSDFPEAFDISSIPRTFLISKEGEIIIDKTGAANWNSDLIRSKIEALLK